MSALFGECPGNILHTREGREWQSRSVTRVLACWVYPLPLGRSPEWPLCGRVRGVRWSGGGSWPSVHRVGVVSWSVVSIVETCQPVAALAASVADALPWPWRGPPRRRRVRGGDGVLETCGDDGVLWGGAGACVLGRPVGGSGLVTPTVGHIISWSAGSGALISFGGHALRTVGRSEAHCD